MARNAWAAGKAVLEKPRPTRVPEHAITMLEGCLPWSAVMTCEHFHRQPIKVGEPYYCPICHGSGYDRQLRLQRIATEAADRERFERQLAELESRAKKQRIKPSKFKLDMEGVL